MFSVLKTFEVSIYDAENPKAFNTEGTEKTEVPESNRQLRLSGCPAFTYIPQARSRRAVLSSPGSGGKRIDGGKIGIGGGTT
jgi:hypothetical protein